MTDDRLNFRGKKIALYNYVLQTELEAGTEFLVAEPGGQLYAVVNDDGQTRVLQLAKAGRGGERWFSYFHTLYGITERSDDNKFIYDALRSYVIKHGTRVELRRFAAYNAMTQTVYLSGYNGRMYKIDGELVQGSPDIKDVAIGEDGVFFVDDDGGLPCVPDIGAHGMLVDRLANGINFVAKGLSGITPEQQRKAFIIWMFALAFPDLLPTKPIMLIEGIKGSGKCLGRGTPVLMFDGSIKAVEDIIDGDLIMGPDSKPRRVRGTTKGYGPLYRINPTKGASWVCNENHILTVVSSGRQNKRGDWTGRGRVVDVALSATKQTKMGTEIAASHEYVMQLRTKVDFKSRTITVDPYLVGLWLGDGTIDQPQINNPEPEIQAFCEEVALRYNTRLRVSYDQRNGLPRLSFSTLEAKWRGRQSNSLLNFFRTLVVNGEKRIPKQYLINDRATRLSLLAGLLDTDGYYQGNYDTKYVGLRDDILFLARSLGFAAYATEKIGTIKETGFKGLYQRITISGHLDQIPCRVTRKQAKPRQQIKDVLRTGFRVEPVGDGEFFGFELDGDGRFLLGDFTITHNTTCAIMLQLVLLGAEKSMILSRNKEDDFGVLLLRRPIALFDNTDSYIEWVPDAIAAYTTLGQWDKRKLFTDDENLTIKPHAFIVVTSRNPASFRRDDVVDRCIILRLDRRENFVAMAHIKAQILADRSQLLGEYLFYVHQIIAEMRINPIDMSLAESHRMADYAAFGRVVGKVLGWPADELDRLMNALQGERDAFSNEEEPLIDILKHWIAYKPKHGPANAGRLLNTVQLHSELDSFAQIHSITWKDSPRSLAQKLKSSQIEREFFIERLTINGQPGFRIWRASDARLTLIDGLQEQPDGG